TGEAAEAERLRWAAIALGVCALAVLVLALVLPWAPLAGWALVALGAEYAVALVDRSSADGWAAVFAAGYLLTGELGYAAVEERHVDRRRLATVAALAVAGAAVAAAVLLMGEAPVGGGLGLEAAGVAAAVAAVAAVSAIVRRG